MDVYPGHYGRLSVIQRIYIVSEKIMGVNWSKLDSLSLLAS